jgi:hypothetical protein
MDICWSLRDSDVMDRTLEYLSTSNAKFEWCSEEEHYDLSEGIWLGMVQTWSLFKKWKEVHCWRACWSCETHHSTTWINRGYSKWTNAKCSKTKRTTIPRSSDWGNSSTECKSSCSGVRVMAKKGCWTTLWMKH